MEYNADLVINNLSVQVANLTKENAVLNAVAVQLNQELQELKKTAETPIQNVVE